MKTIDDTLGRRRAWTWVPQGSRTCMACGQLRRRAWSAYCSSCEPPIEDFLIRAPVGMTFTVRTVRRFVREFERTRGRVPTSAEIQAIIYAKDDIHPRYVAEALRLEAMQPGELDVDTVEDKNAPDLIELALRGLLHREVHQVLRTLTKREALVIRLRFGLYPDGCPRILEEVGAFLKVTRERVRMIEAKALRKLRHPTRTRRLRRFYDPGPARDVYGFPYELPARPAGEHGWSR